MYCIYIDVNISMILLIYFERYFINPRGGNYYIRYILHELHANTPKVLCI